MDEVTFVGTGEACDPGLPNTSLLYRGEKTILVDCGYSVPQALWSLSVDPDLLDAIYITHIHADHSFGLPALLLWLHEMGRTRPLTIIGGGGLENWLAKLMELAYPGLATKKGSFDVDAVSLTSGASHELGPVTIRVARSNHSVENLAVRLEGPGGVLCHSGDGAPTSETEALYAGADLLVHECYADDDAVPVHAHLDQVREMAVRGRVGRLCLLHLGKFYKDRITEKAAQVTDVEVILPRPGDTLPIQA
jgi:ribonuclease BN (tRNA processing enzyme)